MGVSEIGCDGTTHALHRCTAEGWTEEADTPS